MYNTEQLELLKEFVSICEKNPSILHLPQLGFFRTWIEKLGGHIPQPPKAESQPKAAAEEEIPRTSAKPEPATAKQPTPEESEESAESDVELDNTGVIEGDSEEPHEMGDPSVTEISDETAELASEKRSAAQIELGEGNFERAIELFTDAIKLNPNLAVLFAKRANAYVKLKKPNAAIRDCTRALELNPNSHQALKWRGYAYKLLGKWEEAYVDLCAAQKNDFDDDVAQWIKDITPNAVKLREHKRKLERQREERLLKQREQARKRAQEEYDRQKSASGHQHKGSCGDENCDNDHGAGAGAGGIPDLAGLLNDPDLLKDMNDPEVAQALQDISRDPSNLLKYQSNPKVKRVMEKLANKFGGAGGMGGGFPGGMGGFPGMGGMSGGMGGFPGAFDMDPE